MEGVDFFAYFDPDILHFRLERKKSLIDAYIAKVTRFWDHVLNKLPPPPQDENDLIHQYFGNNGKYTQSTPQIEIQVKELIKIKAEKKRLDEQEKDVKFQVKNFIKENDGIQLSDGKKVTLSRVDLKKFDENSFAKANKELYEAHCTEFDEKRFKQNHPEMYEEHLYSRPSTRLILPK